MSLIKPPRTKINYSPLTPSLQSAFSQPPKSNFIKKIFLTTIIALAVFGVFYTITIYLGNNGKLDFLNMSAKVKTYSVITFNPKVPRIVAENDILIGRGLPQGKTTIYITPGNITTDIKVDDSGQWKYQIPKSLKKDKYRMSVQITNKQNYLISIKSYELQIGVDNKISIFEILPGKATFAQTNLDNQFSADEIPWVQLMRNLGIYPARENGEVILYSKQQYVTIYCSANPCLFASEPIELTTDNFNKFANNDKDIISDVVKQAYDSGYKASSLYTYFPDLEKVISDYPEYFKYLNNIHQEPQTRKSEIDENTLSDYINKTTAKYGFAEKDPLKIAFNGVDAIFQVRAIAAFLAQDKTVNRDKWTEGMFALIMLADPFKVNPIPVAKRLTSKMLIKTTNMFNDAHALYNIIRNGEVLPNSLFELRARGWLSQKIDLPIGDYLIKLSDASISSKFITNDAKQLFEYKVLPAIESGEAFTIKKEVVKSTADRLKAIVNDLRARTGRPIPTAAEFDQFIANGYHFAIAEDPSNINGGQMSYDFLYVGIDRSGEISLSSTAQDILAHELAHRIGSRAILQGNKFIVKPEIGSYLSSLDIEAQRNLYVINELMMDALADLSAGRDPLSGRGLYGIGSIIRLSDIASTLNNRVFNKFPELFDIFLEYGITGDANEFIDRVVASAPVQKFLKAKDPAQTNSLSNVEKFNLFFKEARGINFSAVTLLGGIGLTSQISTDPSFNIESNFITDNYNSFYDDLDKKIIITNLVGEETAGSNLNAYSVIYSDTGYVTNTQDFYQIWSLDSFDENTNKDRSIKKVKALKGGEGCQSACTITLPADLTPGEQVLTVYLVKKGFDYILATDTYKLNIIDKQTLILITPEPTISAIPTPIGQSAFDPSKIISPYDCHDNVIEPEYGYKWTSLCAKTCETNADCEKTNGKDGICYGFGQDGNEKRCLKYDCVIIPDQGLWGVMHCY